MKVGVIGAGPIGLGAAALLAERGHEPVVWSPRGSRVPHGAREITIRAEGLLTGTHRVAVVHAPAGIAGADVLLFCVLGNGHRRVMEQVAPHMRPGQVAIISSHASLGALYLSRLLAARGIAPTIAAWATTVTGGPIREGVVQVRLLRAEMDVAALPVERTDAMAALSQDLFGVRFVPAADVLAITLSNLNPPVHMANALLNFTRMERGEVWANYGCITPGVGRLVEALDEERLAVAAAFGLRVRSIREHYRKTHGDLPEAASVSEMSQIVESRRAGSSPGPATAETRYVTEDLPFGIRCVIDIARVAGVAVPLHEAGMALLSATYGRDFAAANDLLPALDLAAMDAAALHRRCREGWPLQASTP